MNEAVSSLDDQRRTGRCFPGINDDRSRIIFSLGE
jgi:hypothetical protein